MSRRFSPYELNLLYKHNIDPKDISDLNIPVEYIVEEVQFCEHSFKVNRSTLIPRVESEYLIEIALRHSNFNTITFADVGCGSGAIGLSFAYELIKQDIETDGYLSDISEEALEIAQANADNLLNLNNLNCFTKGDRKTRLKLITSDLFNKYPKGKRFDIVFANLPYIPSSRIVRLDKSVREYEPISALDGGEDGLDLIRKLLNQGSKYLSPRGLILLEVDDTHDKDKSVEFQNKWEIEVKNDFNGKIRYWICKLKS